VNESSELADPALRKIAMRVVKELELAAEKVVANKAEPTNFPMPKDLNSMERILQSRFQKLKPEQQDIAVKRFMPRLKASSAIRTKSFQDLAQVDLRSVTPVAEQAAALPFPEKLKLSAAALQSIVKADIQPAAAVSQVTDKLEFRILRVKCIDETGIDFNPFGDEPGSDEISLGGSSVDESGNVSKITQFKVGSFDDGDVKNFSPPRRFTMFNLREGTAFPKSYFVTLALAEVDQGGFADFLNKVLDKVKDEVKTALIAAGFAIGSSGGPVGALIGAVVGFAVDKLFELLKSVFQDDIFAPRTVSVKVPSLSHRFAGGKTDSGDKIIRFTGHNGTYDVTVPVHLPCLDGVARGISLAN
jgi:hypothetical protein